MKNLLKSASVIALVAMVAACGGRREEDPIQPDETLAGEATMPATMPSPDEISTPDESPTAATTPTPDATATPTAAASPSPSPTTAARPAAAATVAAVATPPAIFAVCGACHSINPGDHGIGPSLAGVFGARAAHADGFEYSPAMRNSGLTWNDATLNRFLENPREVVPGTTMAYAGLRNAAQRQAVVDYLKTL